MRYYGFAFALAGIVYMIMGIIMLKRYTKRLPYHILSTQPMLVEPKRGLGTKLYERILEMEKRRKKK